VKHFESQVLRNGISSYSITRFWIELLSKFSGAPYAEESWALEIAGLQLHRTPIRWESVWGSWTVASRVRLLGVPHLSPRYSYPRSCSDSQRCFCPRESGRLRWTRSYFLQCLQAVGHSICIGSL